MSLKFDHIPVPQVKLNASLSTSMDSYIRYFWILPPHLGVFYDHTKILVDGIISVLEVLSFVEVISWPLLIAILPAGVGFQIAAREFNLV